MSFSRLPYDNCAYAQKMKRSVTPGDYRLYMGYGENNKKCLPLNAPINSNNGVSSVRRVHETDFGKLVNAESHLTNRVTPISLCEEKSTDMLHKKIKVHHKPICSENVATVNTRFTNPVDTYRGMSLTNYHLTPYLHVNPQNNIQCISHRDGFHSRVWVKNNYKQQNHVKWKDTSLPPSPNIIKKIPQCKIQCN